MAPNHNPDQEGIVHELKKAPVAASRLRREVALRPRELNLICSLCLKSYYEPLKYKLLFFITSEEMLLKKVNLKAKRNRILDLDIRSRASGALGKKNFISISILNTTWATTSTDNDYGEREFFLSGTQHCPINLYNSAWVRKVCRTRPWSSSREYLRDTRVFREYRETLGFPVHCQLLVPFELFHNKWRTILCLTAIE